MTIVGHHAACCLGLNTNHPQLLVSGGRTCNDTGLSDVWMFDLEHKQWEKVRLTHSGGSTVLKTDLKW